MKYTLVLNDKGKRYQISKIVFMKCGGFSVFLPYHNENSGLLTKYEVDYSKKLQTVKCVNEHSYTVENKAKLSLHGDGTIQFSSVKKGTIISGKDENGDFKGLGIKIAPLKNVIETGPICGMTIWGLDSFEE